MATLLLVFGKLRQKISCEHYVGISPPKGEGFHHAKISPRSDCVGGGLVEQMIRGSTKVHYEKILRFAVIDHWAGWVRNL
jgi:hypothetical protein